MSYEQSNQGLSARSHSEMKQRENVLYGNPSNLALQESLASFLDEFADIISGELRIEDLD